MRTGSGDLPAIVGTVMVGEVFAPGEPTHRVGYWRHYHHHWYFGQSVEDCLEFLKDGSSQGELSFLDCTLETICGILVYSYEQLNELA